VRARADSHIVAERPIIHVVPAARAGPGVGGDFVLHVARAGQQVLPGALDSPGRLLVGQLRRPRMKHRPRLESELIIGNVRRLQCARGANVLARFLERLSGRAYIRSRLKLARFAARNSSTARCVSSAGMDAAQNFERARV